MIAERIDHDLGPNAERIQNSFCVAWRVPKSADIFVGLIWAYSDCDNDYAKDEALFLWALGLHL